MGFTIITTVSPEFERAERQFLPTWHANAGADEIVVHHIDEGSWSGNVFRRAELIEAELLERLPRGEKVLALDADCIVLKDLAGGFSDSHIVSVARWPNINMGVLFVNLAVPFKWRRWLKDTVEAIRKESARTDRKETHECDQVVWRPRLHAMDDKVCKLGEWEWNYSDFDMHQWLRDLPPLKDVARVLHFKGHGDWDYARIDEKIAFAKTLWPKELACIA